MKDYEVSENIVAFLNFLRSGKSAYPINFEEMKKQEKIIQDCHHFRELMKLSPKEIRRLDKIEKQCLINRRICKDKVEKWECIVKFLEEDETKKFIKKLENLLGEVRKIEYHHENRCYIPRELSLEDIIDAKIEE